MTCEQRRPKNPGEREGVKPYGAHLSQLLCMGECVRRVGDRAPDRNPLTLVSHFLKKAGVSCRLMEFHYQRRTPRPGQKGAASRQASTPAKPHCLDALETPAGWVDRQGRTWKSREKMMAAHGAPKKTYAVAGRSYLEWDDFVFGPHVLRDIEDEVNMAWMHGGTVQASAPRKARRI